MQTMIDEGVQVDSIVTDPPYELGFMGKSWDSTGIAFQKETWELALQLLKPGGHLLAFGGSRTYHRMAVAIEDAGFEIRDQIMWLYGSGFPKSRNIGKDMEKRKVGGIKNLKKIGEKRGIKLETGTQGYSYSKEYVPGISMGGKQISGDIPVYEITNEYAGWGTALKPAHEPIVMARKPLEGTVADNVLKHGTGGINIDECRVALEGEAPPSGSAKRVYKSNQYTEDKTYGANKTTPANGRFPANVLHDGSEEVMQGFPHTKSGKDINPTAETVSGFFGQDMGYYSQDANYGDEGSAARFFYCAKVSRAERNRGCSAFEERIHDTEDCTNLPSMRTNSVNTSSGKLRKVKPTKNNHPTVIK